MRSVDSMSLEDLREEVAYLRSELGAVQAGRAFTVLRDEFGLEPTAIRLLLALYEGKGRPMSSAAFERAIPPTFVNKRRSNNARVHVCRIRKVIGKGGIATIGKDGWAITPAGTAAVDRALQDAGVTL